MKNKKIIILILILFISTGFAILSSNLSLISNIAIANASFSVHFDTVEKENRIVEDDTITFNDDKTSISLELSLDKPGDYIDYKIYVVNDGTIDAALNSMTVNIPNEIKDYVTYTLTYYNGETPVTGDMIRAGTNKPYKLHIEYKYDVSNFIDLSTSTISVTVSYIQPRNTVAKNVWEFDYENTEQVFVVPKTGTYKLETWGAQGGTVSCNSKVYRGGYGGYSVGTTSLDKDTSIYINVGEQGESGISNTFPQGGYNGGGSTPFNEDAPEWTLNAGGGGATHIAKVPGLLSNLKNKLNEILIISGGGGGGYKHTDEGNNYWGIGGDAGGYKGNDGEGKVLNNYYGIGGTQTLAGCSKTSGVSCGGFGYGGNGGIGSHGSSGGAGLYGGGGCEGLPGYNCSGGGGSGYIGNPNLTDKVMYCYECEQSTEESTKTISTTNVSEMPTSQYAKIGDGFVRITLLN